MTPRERLLAVLHGEMPDCVPVCPDISNMVPARMTGKPFWDIYIYQDPPLWKAHIDALKYFDIDGGFEIYQFGDLFGDEDPKWEQKIVHRNEDGSFVDPGLLRSNRRVEPVRRRPHGGQSARHQRDAAQDRPARRAFDVGGDRGREGMAHRLRTVAPHQGGIGRPGHPGYAQRRVDAPGAESRRDLRVLR